MKTASTFSKGTLLALILILLSFNLIQAQTTWTGSTDDNWTEPLNWSAGIPGSNDDVIISKIGPHDPIIKNGFSALAKSVLIKANNKLTIENGGKLTIDNSAASGLENNGLVENSGKVVIGAIQKVRLYGIYNRMSFNNNAGGEIQIDETLDNGIYNIAGSTFTNVAKITIGSNKKTGEDGIDNRGTFNNNAGGDIQIDETADDGIYNFAGSDFTNEAKITIGSNKKTGRVAINNHGTFSNNVGGDIQIGETVNSGIANFSAGTFENSAKIIIGLNKKTGLHGIQNRGDFLNTGGGEIQIEETHTDGILNNSSGTVENSGKITIGLNKKTGNNAILNSGDFLNTSGGEIQIEETTYSGIVNTSGTFNNLSKITIGLNKKVSEDGISNKSEFSNIDNGEIHIGECNNGIHNIFTFTNAAKIVIGAQAKTINYGILNSKTFINKTGGEIWIEETGSNGIYNNWIFGNEAKIVIGANKKPGSNGIKNHKIFRNNIGGEIQIEETGTNGILHQASTFINYAKITIGLNKKVGTDGINNEWKFSNLDNGEILIGECNNGIKNSFTFTNTAKIVIGASKKPINNGIENTKTFKNDVGGEIQIEETGMDGIKNIAGTFKNSAKITIGANKKPGLNAIFNTSTINNLSCAEFFLFEKLENSGTITNEGLFSLNTTENHIPGTFTNNGIIEDIEGTLPLGGGFVNNDLLIAHRSEWLCLGQVADALNIGNMNSFSVSPKWYTDINLINEAGDYDSGTNIFTPTTIGTGMHTLYMETSDNLNACNKTVSIKLELKEDSEAPELTNCPTNITQSMDAGLCGATISWTAPGAMDNCDANPLVTQTMGASSGTFFTGGTESIQYTATDSKGNSKTCDFTVTVQADAEKPVLICPNNIDVGMDAGVCGATITWTTPNATDNCDGTFAATQTLGSSSGSFFTEGTETIEYTATDAAGNSKTCDFTVTVQADAEKPVLTCPANIDVAMDAGVCGATINWTTPNASDNCDGTFAATQTMGTSNGSFFPEGTETVEYIATDAAGNSKTCDFTVTVQADAEKPNHNGTCAAYPTPFSTDAGNCFATIAFTLPSPTDNCGVTELKAKILDGNGNTFQNWTTNPDGQYPPDNYQIKWRAKDAAGNKKVCTKTFSVVDDENPDAQCVTSHTVQLTNGIGNITTNDIDAGSTDNCNVNLALSQTIFDCNDRGTTTVTLTVTDDAGNMNQCTTDIEVLGTSMTIEDLSLNEGTGAGFTFFFFKVERGAAGCTDQVDYATSDGSATLADNDYVAQNGTHYWPSTGSNVRYTIVRAVKDAHYESDEHFWVDLSNASTGVTITKAQGKAELLNDDAAPLYVNPNQDIENANFVQHQIQENKVALYPNPTKKEFQLILPGEWLEGGAIEVTLFNDFGQHLSSFQLMDNQAIIDVDHLPVGIYQLVLKTATGTLHSERFVKIK